MVFLLYSVIPTGAAGFFFRAEFWRASRGVEGPRQDQNLIIYFVRRAGRCCRATLAFAAPYIFSGASIPNNPNATTNCRSTNSVNPNKNARFSSSASDKI